MILKMKKNAVINNLDALKAAAINDWVQFQQSFGLYLNEYDKSQIYNSNSCGDDRFPIIQGVFKAFEEDEKLTFPEEINRAEMASQLQTYEDFLMFSGKFTGANSKLSTIKVHLGTSLGNKLTIMSQYLVYKASNNSDYKTVSDLALTYFDPAEKRKQTNLDKKRVKRTEVNKNKGKDKP
jgi:hypothetical protein